jgi:recombination protein RecR
MYEGPVQDLIEELGRLPGIGPKSAQRLAFHLLTVEPADAERLANAIIAVKERVHFCERCFNVAEAEECRICRDARRDAALLCVVEEPRDLMAVEKTNEFSGRYHVLGGAISPIDGVGPDQLRVKELVARIGSEGIREVVIATNPNIEGEATASYLARVLKGLSTDEHPLRVSRIASGLPVGGDLEYADEVTLGRAFAGRRDV